MSKGMFKRMSVEDIDKDIDKDIDIMDKPMYLYIKSQERPTVHTDIYNPSKNDGNLDDERNVDEEKLKEDDAML